MTTNGRTNNKNSNTRNEALDKERIVQTAIVLLNKEGYHNLTMRKLAAALDIRAASLYWYIKNKDELIQLISDEISSKIPLPDSKKNWKDQLKSIAISYRGVLLSIRDSAEVMAYTIPITPHRLRLIENLYQILIQAGFSPADVVSTAAFYNNYILSFVMDEMKMIHNQGLNTEKARDEVINIFKSLPSDKYPAIVKLADYSTSLEMDKQFEFGLDVLLSGLSKRLEKNDL
ncbi:TetR family transcriptional regulator [Bacillus methanolicus PB1]|uniref:TetR family transcriptional regulator n=1 Tax=Bacillus methanolicus PB1 TaxID=997296 RepID=I3E5I5_BACMT|nr:TetR/AcrR family transcriptional regulator C-terminal domain-containing protein [Bacillus methanolicus]EIJ81756.1 TetR family transcriptional regulator [Bacillus methanolicus PB1]